MNPIEVIRLLSSTILGGRAALSEALGSTFGGNRNMYDVLGFKKNLGTADYNFRYDRGGIAARIVDAYPDATWRGDIEVIEDEDPSVVTDFEQAFDELVIRLDLFSKILEADKYAGKNRYAALLIGARGKLDQPLVRASFDDVFLLTPLEEDDAKIDEYNIDSENPHFGLPEYYKINLRLNQNKQASALDEQRTHWTRVIHFAEGSNVFGKPRLERVWNDLDNLEKIVGAGSEAFWLRANQGLQIDLDKDIKMTPGSQEEKDMAEEVDEYVNGLRRVMRTRGVKVTTLGSDVANFDRNVASLLSLISGATGIPQRILLGSERGELASTQDRNNWSERVTDRRTRYAGPMILRRIVDRFIELGTLPTPSEYVIRWPNVSDLTLTERADLALKHADLNSKMGETVMTAGEIRDHDLGLDALDEDQQEFDEEETDVDVEEDEELARAAASFKDAGEGAPEPEWRAIHRAADAHRERFRRYFEQTFDEARLSVNTKVLEDAFRAQNGGLVERIIDQALARLSKKWSADLPDRFAAVVRAGGKAASDNGLRVARKIEFDFDLQSQKITKWSTAKSAELVADITTETRAAIRAAIDQIFAEGLAPRDAARLIRPLVGLSERQAMAVINLRFKLLEANPGTLVMAGKMRIRIPSKGIPADTINRVAKKYADRLVRQRALDIARTETLAASNEGQRQLWSQAVEKGLLTGVELREWIYTPVGACQRCQAMDGQIRGLDEPFQTPEGLSVMSPPLHNRCRCAQGLSAKRQRDAA